MRSHLTAFPLCAAFLLSGCGEGPPEETYPVTGRATFDGEPVKGATVTFVPDQGRRPALGITDDDGEYELATFSKGDGAVAGTHTVTVILTNPGETMIIAGRPSKNAIPNRYSMPDQTPFKFEVTPDGENRFDLAMTKDAK